MRIVIDVRTMCDHFPGIGRHTFDLARTLALQIDQDELILLTNPDLPNTRFDLSSIKSSSRVRTEATRSRPFTLWEQVRLPAELKVLRPDVIHFPYPMIPFGAQRPIIISVHDLIPIRLPQYFSFRHRVLYRISLRLGLRAADAVICPSRATFSDLQSVFHLDASRLFMVPAGIGETFHPRTAGELKSAKAIYRLPDQYILYVGSNKPHKNLTALVDAYARLQGAPLLVIAGQEDARYLDIRHRVDSLGLGEKIRFAGAIPEKDLPVIYSGSMAFIFPSLYEGFGFPPLEAMACGAPVACSDIACLRETAGDAALFFDPHSPESITNAITRILRDLELRATLRKRGQRRAAELSWDHAARQTLEIYRRAIAR